MQMQFFRRSVNVALPSFGRVNAGPILDRAPVAREHLRDITNCHSVLLTQANCVLSHLPSGSEVAGIFILHVSTPR